MLLPAPKLLLSSYSALYDLIIPKENLLRKINDLIDFTFIYNELESKYCLDNGRVAESPIRMFKYLLLKTIYEISDVDVVERSFVDMSFKYFLGMTPEEAVIDPSSLTKFRKLRLKDADLLNLLISKTVSIAFEKGIIKSKSLIVDATHTTSRSNPLPPLQVLRERAQKLRKVVYSVDENLKEGMPKKNEDDDLGHELAYCVELEKNIESNDLLCSLPKIKEKLNLLKETIVDAADHYTLSKDPDARIGHKTKDSSFFGFKTHIAMTQERIITAAVVTSGEKGDGPELPTLLATSQKNGLQVDTIIGDAAYSGKDNLKMAREQEIKIVAKLKPQIAQGTRKQEDTFNYNKDAGMFVCPTGHMAIRKARQGKKESNQSQAETYYFDVEKCKTCAISKNCYKPGAKTKTYSVCIKSNEHTDQILFQKSDYFKENARSRYKIEAKNSELKNVHGYAKASSYGIGAMQMQGAIAIFVVNLKRILTLNN